MTEEKAAFSMPNPEAVQAEINTVTARIKGLKLLRRGQAEVLEVNDPGDVLGALPDHQKLGEIIEGEELVLARLKRAHKAAVAYYGETE